MAKITKERIEEYSSRFLSWCDITDIEVEIAQNSIDAFEFQQRFIKSPMSGDVIEGIDCYGDCFKKGRITREDNGFYEVCVHPSIPFVSSDGIEYWLSCSGGPFFYAPESRMELLGEEEALFNDWGRMGGRKDGAITFPIKVRRWLLHKLKFKSIGVVGMSEDPLKAEVGYLILDSEYIDKAVGPRYSDSGIPVKVYLKDGRVIEKEMQRYSILLTVEVVEAELQKGVYDDLA